MSTSITPTIAPASFLPGSSARQTLERVADFYSEILDDTFSPIVTPPPFTSSLPPEENPGIASWQWTLSFSNPGGPGQITLVDQSIDADEYRLYVGAESLSGNTLGRGGPGGFGYQGGGNGGYFTEEEIEQLQMTGAQFNAAVTKRGETSGFARWGGAVAFDSDATANWHFDNTPPPAGKNDFLSVAVHEIGHALGLGSSDNWNALTAGSGDNAYFSGSAAIASYGGLVPLAFHTDGAEPIADKAHWREGTMSNVFGSATPQAAAMGPSITVGTRKRLTALDAAALSDIGWTVVPLEVPGDFNHDNTVDAADYSVWRDGLGSQYSADDYQTWKSHYGQSPPGNAAECALGRT